jgi:hypothetical protein
MTRAQSPGPEARPGRQGFGLSRTLFILVASFAISGCAPARISLPADPGSPFPEFARAYREATVACAGARTLTAELGLSGRAGGRGMRGRAIVGFSRPASMRLEGVAPFGPPAFILAAREGSAVLLLPRDNRVLRDEPAEEILRALTGVGLTPGELLAVVTGCVATVPNGLGGRLHGNGWLAVDLPENAVVYLERTATGWRPRAARRAGWQIEYSAWQGNFPQSVRLRADDPAANVDVTATVSQLEVNVAIDPAAFEVVIPPEARSLTLAELRRSGPLGEP